MLRVNAGSSVVEERWHRITVWAPIASSSSPGSGSKMFTWLAISIACQLSTFSSSGVHCVMPPVWLFLAMTPTPTLGSKYVFCILDGDDLADSVSPFGCVRWNIVKGTGLLSLALVRREPNSDVPTEQAPLLCFVASLPPESLLAIPLSCSSNRDLLTCWCFGTWCGWWGCLVLLLLLLLLLWIWRRGRGGPRLCRAFLLPALR